MFKKLLGALPLLLFLGLFIQTNLLIASDVAFEEINAQITLFKSSTQQGLIITDEERSVVIDPIDRKTANEIKSFLQQTNKSSVTEIIYTHSHWDRIRGGEALKDKKTAIIAQKNCEIYFSGNKNKEVVEPNIYFDESYTLKIGEEILKLHYFGPSHGECMLIAELVNAKILFIPDLVSTKGARFPKDPTLPFLRPATLGAFFDSMQNLANAKQIDVFISGEFNEKTFGSTEIINQQKIFWGEIEAMAIIAEEKGLVDLNNFIDIEKMDLQKIRQYENFNEKDLVNILRRYTSFFNMGR